MSHRSLRFPGFRTKAVTLSYDDGVVFDRELVKIMAEHGLKGTFNISGGFLAEKSGGYYLTAEEALSLYTAGGHEIAAHGYRHLGLAEVDSAEAVYDVIMGRISLEKLTGSPVRGMAYAGGSYDDTVVEILRHSGIVYCRTSVSSGNFNLPADWYRIESTCRHRDPRLMELAEEFLAIPPEGQDGWYRCRPAWFYVMGHSYEFNNDNNWYIMENLASLIGKREEIWYATNMEIYDYVKAYEALVYAADSSFVYNPSLLDVYIHRQEGKFIIPSGQAVRMR